jgi:hypothetical protein
MKMNTEATPKLSIAELVKEFEKRGISCSSEYPGNVCVRSHCMRIEELSRLAVTHGSVDKVAEFLAGLPGPLHVVRGLFTFLREEIECCERSLFETRRYARVSGLEESRLIGWVERHGGLCDCEVYVSVPDFYPEFLSAFGDRSARIATINGYSDHLTSKVHAVQ